MNIGAELGQYLCASTHSKNAEDSIEPLNPHPLGTPLARTVQNPQTSNAQHEYPMTERKIKIKTKYKNRFV